MKEFTAPKYELALFQNAPIPIAKVNTDGTMIAVNQAWSDILGYSESELVNMTFADFTHPADIEPDKKMVKELLENPETKRSYSMIKRYITKQGKSKWVELFVQSMIENKKVAYFIVHVIPLPNGGKFKVEHVNDKTVHVRPTITMIQFLKDNWKWTIGIVATVAFFLFKLVSTMALVLEKLEIPW